MLKSLTEIASKAKTLRFMKDQNGPSFGLKVRKVKEEQMKGGKSSEEFKR